MSGAKRITVDSTAWREAQAAAARLRTVQRDVPRLVEAVRRQQREELDRVFGGMEGRQRRVEQVLTGLSDEAKRSELRTAKRLREQADRLRGQIGSAVEQVRGEQDERIRAAIERERADRRAEIQELGRELDGLRGDRERAASAAGRTLADARLMRDAIRAGLPHERFAPGRLDRLERRIATAESNLAAGLAAESLSLLQETFLDLAELRADLVLLDQEWQAARLAALDALTVVAERIRFSARLPAPDERGEPIDGLSFDVDHWSGGGLAALRADLEERTGEVGDGSPLGTGELREIVRRDAPELERRLEETVARATAALLASQARVNVAEQVVDAVEHATGFAWTENAYAGDDQRAAFYSKLRHLNDNEIVIEVAHEDGDEDDGPGTLAVRILSYDRDTASEEELAERAREIATSLRERGLPVGEPTEEAPRPDPALTDFAALRTEAVRSEGGRSEGGRSEGGRSEGGRSRPDVRR
ncbi:hypothetical protein AGRA3207_003430 [Actinomadura graeca]|uniref:Uncharacterized protein n=1 Tax=Actinomadura graeca TaxID=2750812 RepID=A0ABX8QWS6_9ACTN|nr:hypothetical protein [Actinomadura graeca]QXJ22434.1 hypothetical protein AGRA3207_003430 [Actinomadura graeca]